MQYLNKNFGFLRKENLPFFFLTHISIIRMNGKMYETALYEIFLNAFYFVYDFMEIRKTVPKPSSQNVYKC